VNKSQPRLPGNVVAVAGWVAVALLVTGVTLAAVTLTGSGIFGDSTRARSQAEVAQALAALTTTIPSTAGTSNSAASSAAPTSPAPSTTNPSPSPATPETSVSTALPPVRRLITSAGGSVLAECTGRDVVVVSWTPAQGYRVDDVDLEARRDVEVRFEGEDAEVRVKIRCADGWPVAEIEEDG
jgi:hypothetical protein